jgi:hypothetical protein
MEGKPDIVPQLCRRSVKSQASPSIFMGKEWFFLLAVASALRCKDDAISTLKSHSREDQHDQNSGRLRDCRNVSETSKTCATGAIRSSKFWVRSSENFELGTSNCSRSRSPRFSRMSRESRASNEIRITRCGRYTMTRISGTKMITSRRR